MIISTELQAPVPYHRGPNQYILAKSKMSKFDGF